MPKTLVVSDKENYWEDSEFYAEQNGTVRLGYREGESEKESGESELYIGLKNKEKLFDGITERLKMTIPLNGQPDCDMFEQGGYFEVHGITEEGWTEREVSWDSRPETSSKIIAFAKPVANEEQAEGKRGYTLTFDIAPSFVSKYTGFAIKASRETDYYESGLRNSVNIPGEAMKSQVEVQATSAEKEEVRGSKSIQQSCNQAGTGAIDLFTGDISFVHEDVNWQGTQIPMGISHIYSSKFYDKEADETYKCGVGWRLSILQTLKEDPEAESEAPDFKSYIYTDASGIKQTISTRYYKTITSDDGTREFKIYGTEKDGSNGEEISNGTYKLAVGSTQNILTDKAGNKLKFNVSDGRLVGMETVDGLKLTVTYNANSIDVTDFNNRKLTLGFSGNKLQSIMSGTSLIRSYSYQTDNSKNYLKSIENYFGESNFEYNDSGYLYKITDPSKYIVEYKIGADEGLSVYGI